MSLCLREFFAAIVANYDPGRLVREYLCAERIEGDSITLVALGKAAVPMALGAREALGERIQFEVVVAPSLPTGAPCSWYVGSHPEPSAQSERAARALLQAVRDASGTVVALISGGGSALAAQPAAGLSLEEKAEFLGEVYAAGADIEELNVVRKHLSSFKGGQLAAVSRQPIITLVLSDVVGDSLSAVASGPTIADPSTYRDALAIVEGYGVGARSGTVLGHLRAGAAGRRKETPSQARKGDVAVLLAGMKSFLDFARAQAMILGATAHAVPETLDGTVEAAAGRLAADIALALHEEPQVRIYAGETTIALPTSPGCGGRAQHLALLMAKRIAGLSNVRILSVGSDGIDGNSEAAGAIVDGNTWAQIGIGAREALENCDSATVLARVDAQIVTGPTGINHADLVVVQIW